MTRFFSLYQMSRVKIVGLPLELNCTHSLPHKRRGSYTYLDEETRTKIGNDAAEHGPTKAASIFSTELKLEKPLSHSSAIRFRDVYLKSLNMNPSSDKSIPRE